MTTSRHWRTCFAPLQASFRRSLGEALLGWIVLGALSGAAWWHTAAAPGLYPRALFVPLAWLWVILWPVWRLRRIRQPRRWVRMGVAMLRLIAIGCVITVDWLPPLAVAEISPTHLAMRLAAETLLLACLRMLVLAAATLRGWVRRRLYRQLVISHLAVIGIILVALTAGTITLAISLAAITWPSAATQAQAVTDTLQGSITGNGVDAGRAQAMLDALESNRIRTGFPGRSLVLYLVPWRVLFRRALVLDRQGTVVAAAHSSSTVRLCDGPAATVPLPEPLRSRLIHGALSGSVTSAPVPAALACGLNVQDQFFVAAPLPAPDHAAPVGAVILQGTRASALISNIAPLVFVGSSAAGSLLLVVVILPALALSAGASYFFARGVTRRMGEVSRAAEAIAAGDLSRRVPVTTQNEIGRLAGDFNRMAAAQEQVIAALQQARTQAEQALQARQELIAGVSHELRTPIAIVQAHLDTVHLQQDDTPDGAVRVPAHTLEALRHELVRLAGLVDDLFTLARVETGALHLRCEPTRIAALITDVADLLRPLARQESAVTLTVQLPPVLPEVLADADRLRQIVANLVRNAIRHTPEGGIISLGATAEDGWVVLSVADTGEGIAPEHLPHLFERFYRADPARSRASGGAGLGLAIVQEFVEEMGGRVAVQSTPGEGTCFQVYLRRTDAGSAHGSKPTAHDGASTTPPLPAAAQR